MSTEAQGGDAGPVRYEVDGSTALITLDAPHNRNALTPELVAGIEDGLTKAEEDSAVRAVVLTHTGRVFCAGADLKGQSKTSGEQGEGDDGAALETLKERSRHGGRVMRRLLASPRPIIAAIDGHVRAGGMGFVAACDVVIAGPGATFGLSEVRVGVVAATIGPLVLARIGERTAAEWFLRGNAVSAAEAQSAGFVTRAVDGEDVSVDRAVEEVLADLRKGAPAALAASKALVNRAVLMRVDREDEEMVDLSAGFFAGADAQLGMAAFLNKEQPPWVVDR